MTLDPDDVFALIGVAWYPASVWCRNECMRASFKSKEASTARPQDRALPSPTDERPRNERSRTLTGLQDRPRARHARESTDPHRRVMTHAQHTRRQQRQWKGSWWRARRRKAEGCIRFVASALARAVVERGTASQD